jgi:hypothetical protein
LSFLEIKNYGLGNSRDHSFRVIRFFRNKGFRFSRYLGLEVLRNKCFQVSRNLGIQVARILSFKESR